MRSLRVCAALGSVLVALATAAPAHAGWQSVFQVTCFGCTTPSTSSYFSSSNYSYSAFAAPSDPCCNPCPCPQQVAVTRYVQRTFYEPVVSYRLETTFQPVTSYRTSFFWEPVTTYRYSCYFDPCTCSYKQMACPSTCYRLRSQCCPVTNYVQRCNYVPVTTYRQSCYWEPQTCYSLVDPCTGQVINNGSAGAAAPAASGGAGVRDSSGGAGVQEYRGNPAVPGNPGYQAPTLDGGKGSGSSYRRETERRYVEPPPPEPVKPIVPKINSIAFEDEPKMDGANLLGQVVTNDGQIIKNGARLLFVSDATTGDRKESATDGAGKFRVNLGTGTWKIYVRDDRGQPVYQTQVTVQEKEVRQMTLVSRR